MGKGDSSRLLSVNRDEAVGDGSLINLQGVHPACIKLVYSDVCNIFDRDFNISAKE